MIRKYIVIASYNGGILSWESIASGFKHPFERVSSDLIQSWKNHSEKIIGSDCIITGFYRIKLDKEDKKVK